jgi:hypothetical protein
VGAGVERVERTFLERVELEPPVGFERRAPGLGHDVGQGVDVDAGVLSEVGVLLDVGVVLAVGDVVGVVVGDEDPRFLLGRNAHTSAAVTTMMTSAHTTACANSRRSRGGL